MTTYKPRKRFGQNFLHDHFVISKLINLINPTITDHIIEIGPGLGAITKPLLPLVAQLDVIELDRDLIPKLVAKCNQQSNLNVHQADILKFDLADIIPNHTKIRIVGNLPYNISTPLLFKLINYIEQIKDINVMLQKEVAERLIAVPGNKNYGRLTIMIQYYFEVKLLCKVFPTAFKPVPKVNSAFISLTPKMHSHNTVIDINIFKEITRLAFNQRRKTIQNALKTVIGKEIFNKLNIKPTSRPEQLTIEDYITLSNHLASK